MRKISRDATKAQQSECMLNPGSTHASSNRELCQQYPIALDTKDKKSEVEDEC